MAEETYPMTEDEKKIFWLRGRRNQLLEASEKDGHGRDDRPFTVAEKTWRATLRDLPATLDLDDIVGTLTEGYTYIIPEWPSSLSETMENSGYSGYCKIVEDDGWTHLPSVERTVANGGLPA